MEADSQLSWAWSVEGSFPSDMKWAHDLIEQVMEQIRSNSWSNRDEFAVNMALEESLVNAVQHGNNSDPKKNVHFNCRLNSCLFYARIEDEGEGFDLDAIPDPTDPEHITIASGRGVLLIKSFVTNVRWNKKGNVLEFEKRTSPSPVNPIGLTPSNGH
jgi:serine/threonine-protein kinase RsbW